MATAYMRLFLWAITVCLCSGLIDVRYDALNITLHVFSGTRDPVWHVQHGSPAFSALERRLQGHSNTELDPRLGYSGFTVDWLRGHGHYTMTIGRCSDPDTEQFILEQLKPLAPAGETLPLANNVVDYVLSDIKNCGTQ